jgi:hypothetical protein
MSSKKTTGTFPPAEHRRGRWDARTFYGVECLFKKKRPREVAEMMGKSGFVAGAWKGDGFITMLDVTAPRGITRRPIRWSCDQTAEGTRIWYCVLSKLEQRRMNAFLQAVSRGDHASIPELVSAMRLTAVQD